MSKCADMQTPLRNNMWERKLELVAVQRIVLHTGMVNLVLYYFSMLLRKTKGVVKQDIAALARAKCHELGMMIKPL